MSIPSLYDEHDLPRTNAGVRWLVAINVAVMFLQWTLVSRADSFAVLGFEDANLQRSLWSAVSYMFVHYGVWHLVLNMYALVAFGTRLEAAMGTRAFVLYYLWCGIGGTVAQLLFVRTGMLLGSTAAVLGVLFAYVQQWPRDEVALFGVLPMRAWTLMVVLTTAIFALGVAGASDPLAGGQPLSYFAHLGGLAFGWLYFRTPPAASLDRLRQRISPAPDYGDDLPPRAIPRTLPRSRAQRDDVDEIVAQSNAVAMQRPAVRNVVAPPRRSGEQRVADLDRVLDKISSSGMESLSREERSLLDETARRLRED